MIGERRSSVAERIAFAAALALLLAQTVGPATHSPLGIDEQVTYYVAAGGVPETVFERATQQSATPPLYFWLVAACERLAERWSFNPSEIALRFPSLVFAAASLVLVRRFGSAAGGCGAAAALLLAAHPQLVFHATQSRPYAAGVFFNLLAGWCLFRLRRPGWNWGHLIGLLVANACLLWTHYLFAAAVAIQPLLWLTAPTGRAAVEERRSFGFFGGSLLSASCVLLAFPLVPAMLTLQTKAPYLNWVTERRPWIEHFDLLLFAEGDPRSPIAWLPIGAAILTAAIVAAFSRRRARVEKADDENRLSEAGVEPASVVPGETSEPAGVSVRMIVFFFLWTVGPTILFWAAGEFVDPALAQSRYAATQLGPACLLLASLFVRIGTVPGGIAAAVVLTIASGALNRTADVLANPVRQDSHWKNAAELLNEKARAEDLILVQSGLVETKLVRLSYGDPGFQEYVTSRLSDFYLTVAADRLSLPMFWSPENAEAAKWRAAYERRILQAVDAGGQIWLVVSADSDVGEAAEAGAVAWLSQRGFDVRTIDDNRVARVHHAQFRPRGI